MFRTFAEKKIILELQAGTEGTASGTAGKGVYGQAPSSLPPVDPGTNLIPVVTPNLDPSGQQIYETGGSQGKTTQLTVRNGASATILAYQNPCRIAIKITKLDANDLFLGFGPGVSSVDGDLLSGARGSFVVIPSTLSIYANTAAGVTAQVSTMEISV